jgi:hypothetical protein
MLNQSPSGFTAGSDGRDAGKIALKDGILPSSETERQGTDDTEETLDKTQRAAGNPAALRRLLTML